MTKNTFHNYWQRFETFCTSSRSIDLVTILGNNFQEHNDLQSLFSCYCCPADQSKLMTDVCWNKCDSLWSWCGISSAASISFYAFHTFLLAWMDHNGRMWFERSLGGPETHIPNSTISYPAPENHIPYPYHNIPSSWEPHTIPLPYHTTGRIPYSHSISPRSSIPRGLHIHFKADPWSRIVRRFDVYKATPHGVDQCFHWEKTTLHILGDDHDQGWVPT